MYLIKTNTFIITRFLISIQLLLFVVDALENSNNNNNNNRFLLPRIIEQPKSQVAISGSKVQFKCDYEIIDTITLRSTLSLSSHIQIKWLFNLMPIDIVFNQNLDYMQDNNKLTLLSFDETKQSGEYRCLINNTYQGWSVLSEPANVSLAYIDKEQLDKNNENSVYLNISEGNVAIIQCKLPASNPPAIPIFVFNNTILIDNEIPRYKIFSSGNLQISNVKHTDSGIYTCSARNPITNEIRNNTKQTILRVFEPVGTQTPEIIYAPNDANRVQIGSNLTLECVSNGAPVPLVSWEKFGGTLPEKRSTQIFGNLIITNIQPEDKGTYVCRADNGPGQATFKTAMLDVFEAPTLLVLNDGSASSNSNTQIVKYYTNKNDNIELKCPIRSRPKSDVVWFFNGRLLNTNQRVSTTYLITDRSLLIKNVNQQLIGPYQCYAKNDYGYKQAQIMLYLKEDMQQQNNVDTNTNVAVESSGGSGSGISSSEALPYSSTYGQRPVILIGPQNVTIYEGQTAVLLCVTDSNSQINWLKNDIIIEPSLMRRFEINPVGNLRIVSAQKSDTGVYKCIASNEYGMSSAEGYVFVKDDELSQQQQQQQLQRKPQLQSQPKSNDNQFDDAKYSKQQLVTPVRPQIEQIDVDKILLKWGLNTNNVDNSDTEALTRINEEIDYFKIEYKTYPIVNNNNKKQFSNNWITIDEKIDSTKREYILTDLSPNEQYRFRISCFSKTGQQTHSQQSLKFKLEVKQHSSQSSTIQAPLAGGSGSLPSSPASSNDNTIEIQIQQVWAISDSSLAIKWQLFDNNDANTSSPTTNGRQMIDGFYIYYRKLVNIPSVVSSQQTTTPSLSAYQTITLPNSPLHLVDTYVITNLDASSTYEIKVTCFSSTQKVTCDISNTIYGLTLNKDFINTNSLKPHILNKLNEQQFINNNNNNDLANTSTKQNEIVFMVVGIALGVLSLLLIMFMVMCIIRHRERRRLMKKLNASQKLTGGSSCPTLIYDDCIRNQHQQNIKPLFDKTSTLNNMLLINNLQPTQVNDPNHIQPPPLPIVPPPSINTMSRNNQSNMNININPLGSYLDASNIATFAFLNNKEQQQQQENFYHTLNTTICNQFANGTLNPHAYDYNNATLNLRAQLIFKQQQLQALQMSEQHQQQQQQQQQKQRNTLQRASFSSSSTSDRTSLERNNENKTSSLTPKKRARRNGSNRKMKKVDKVYQQVLHPNEQQTLLFANQQQQQNQLQQNVDLINIETPYQTNNRLFANPNFLLLAQKYQNQIESHHLNNHHHQNDLLIATTNSNSSSGIGSSSTDCGNEELVPFIFSNNAALNSNINNTTSTTTANNNTNNTLDNEQETAYANSN